MLVVRVIINYYPPAHLALQLHPVLYPGLYSILDNVYNVHQFTPGSNIYILSGGVAYHMEAQDDCKVCTQIKVLIHLFKF